MRNYLLYLIVLVVVFSLLPWVDIALKVGDKWQGVVSIEMYADSQYYHARMREIKDGHPLIGNPFYIEYNESLPPTFFFADWLFAIPMFFGVSLTSTLIFNFSFWSVLFAILSYAFFILAGFSKKTSFWVAFFLYLLSYIPLLRPVSFQIVYPVFLLFLISFILWLKNPRSNRNILFLALSASLSFYIYTYLWQIVFVILGLWFVLLLFEKRFDDLKSFFKVAALAFVFSAPMIVFMWKQIHQPYFWETMLRHGLVLTRLPTANVFYSGKWVVFALLLWWLARKFIIILRNDEQYNLYFSFFGISGVALLLTSVSNIFTGKEFEISMHVEYFITLWLGLAFIIFLFFFFKNSDLFKNMTIKKKMALAILSFLCIVGIGRYFYIYSPLFFLREDNEKIRNYLVDIQSVAGPLNWLEENEPEPKVIWASYDSPINIFIPILTKHYVLFTEIAKVQVVPSREHEERYLISGYFKDLTLNDIKNEFVLYAGRAIAIYNYQTHNRKVKLCNLLKLYYFGFSCGEITDALSYQGDEYFNNLHSRYLSEIKPNIEKELSKFNVSYIIKDRFIDRKFHPENFNGTPKVYDDQRFEIYKINI